MFDGQGLLGKWLGHIAPLGAYFADDLETLVTQAELSATVTHCHPETVAEAVAVALAAGVAWRVRDSGRVPNPTEFLYQIHERTPVSEVRHGIRKAIDLADDTSIEAAAGRLGNGYHVTVQDTVPFAPWSAAHHLHHFEDALWATVSGKGDRDTTCAIVGGIVVMSAGLDSIPRQWLEHREELPNHKL